ncbi:MAG: type IV toxin-antitoxin system AbiEi family antitoxin domain-containing protein [Archangium sp.]
MAKLRRSKKAEPNTLEAWKPSAFIAQNPVFTLDELRRAYRDMGRDPASAQELVSYYLAQGTLLLVRRGIYAHPTWVDPFRLASRLTSDAVVAYDGALAFHKLTPVGHSVHFASTRRTPRLTWIDISFEVVRLETLPPHETIDSVRVTPLERTLVDALDRLDLAPDLKTLWSAFGAAPRIDSRRLLHHLDKLDRGPLLASRLGLFLEARNDGDANLTAALKARALKAPAYFDRATREDGMKIISRWNLIAPDVLHDLSA